MSSGRELEVDAYPVPREQGNVNAAGGSDTIAPLATKMRLELIGLTEG